LPRGVTGALIGNQIGRGNGNGFRHECSQAQYGIRDGNRGNFLIGAAITLTAASGTGCQAWSPVSFTPPNRPLDNGDVYISLGLAKQRLESLGITQPTPEQIKAALVGGTITTGSNRRTYGDVARRAYAAQPRHELEQHCPVARREAWNGGERDEKRQL
jgi:hypothetical protein